MSFALSPFSLSIDFGDSMSRFKPDLLFCKNQSKIASSLSNSNKYFCFFSCSLRSLCFGVPFNQRVGSKCFPLYELCHVYFQRSGVQMVRCRRSGLLPKQRFVPGRPFKQFIKIMEELSLDLLSNAYIECVLGDSHSLFFRYGRFAPQTSPTKPLQKLIGGFPRLLSHLG